MKIDFDNTYIELPERFYSEREPVPVDAPKTIRVNDALGRRLGFDVDWLASDEGAEFAVGNRLLEGSEPIAMAYAGHQFGNFVPKLGDGRAVLLGEVVDDEGERFDIQLKGSGRTPFSRNGDGRAPLGPVLREYLISEAMDALGIPTTRSLVAAETGEGVRRESIQPGGVLVRVAKSHIRVGTFEFFAVRDDADAIRTLVNYVIERHYPELSPDSPVALLRAVATRQARLVAQWQLVGFIHGVMNTDNMLVSGETIDYGPCAFMNEYDPETVFSSIDRRGRYAFRNQPGIANWNLCRFAEALLLLDDEQGAMQTQIQDVIDEFPDILHDAYAEGMGAKLGLGEFRDEDWGLLTDLLQMMHEQETDMTLTFRRLSERVDPDFAGRSVADVFELPDAFDDWLERWSARIDERDASRADIGEGMRAVNPVVITRNHLVNAAIEDAVEHGDYTEFHRLVDTVLEPFDFPDDDTFVRPPAPDERIAATFCGT